MRKRAKPLAIFILCALLAAFLLTGCAQKAAPAPTPTPTPAAQTAETGDAAEEPVSQAEDAPQEATEATESAEPEPTPEPTPEPPTVPPELSAALEEVRDLIDSHSCYAAFQKILALEENYKDNSAAVGECEALFEKLDLLLRDLEPQSGTELERSFSVQGGCVLEIDAFSGPVLVTVTDAMALMEGAENPAQVRFYVRQGELGQTHLPAGTYLIQYQVGYRWFGAELGFGEYCTEGMLEEPMVFDFYMDGQWASNSKYTITL